MTLIRGSVSLFLARPRGTSEARKKRKRLSYSSHHENVQPECKVKNVKGVEQECPTRVLSNSVGGRKTAARVARKTRASSQQRVSNKGVLGRVLSKTVVRERFKQQREAKSVSQERSAT